ncbi:MAG: hypothetical protein HY517_01610 [Candidatus Aenigmarchaeota archaeon]|nr:hypothetical protein [Candidatus Aenigmarchaeota archaeon]
MNRIVIALIIISSILIAGCTAPTGQVTGCQPNWIRQDIAVLNDDGGAEYCRTHCLNSFNAKGKLIQETVLETRCYCELNRC